MSVPPLVQNLLHAQAAGDAERSLSLTVLVFEGECRQYNTQQPEEVEAAIDDEIAHFVQVGDHHALRFVGWSEEHSALIYEPKSSIEFEYERDQPVGYVDDETDYLGGYLAKPDDQGPYFRIHFTDVSPYADLDERHKRRGPPFKYTVGDYWWDDGVDDPTGLLMHWVGMFDGDIAAEVEAEATNEVEDPAYTELIEDLKNSGEEDVKMNLGWNGPWARKLVAMAQENPTKSLGTFVRLAWIPNDFGVEMCLETDRVDSFDLFDLHDDFPLESSPIRSMHVIKRYRIRGKVVRLFVKVPQLQSMEKKAGLSHIGDATRIAIKAEPKIEPLDGAAEGDAKVKQEVPAKIESKTPANVHLDLKADPGEVKTKKEERNDSRTLTKVEEHLEVKVKRDTQGKEVSSSVAVADADITSALGHHTHEPALIL